MATVQLTSREKRALILWVLAGVLGLWYAHRNFFKAFPEASVNFKVPREEAQRRARAFVEAQGQSLEGYRAVIVFGVDDNAKTYLERELGLQEANRLMAGEVNAWHWNVRFFKPEQEEEFRVAVSPEGAIAGYQHKIPEARVGTSPSREEAQTSAQTFLTSQLKKNARDWDFLPEEANSEKKPNRLDWSFSWERHGFKAKDAPERLQIVVQGGVVGGAREQLKVPEQWERSYAHLRSTNIFYNQVALVPYFLFFGAALWLGIDFWRKGKTTWTLAFQLGALVTVFLTAMNLNRWPLELYGYDTNSTFGSFTLNQILGALAFGVLSALTVTLVLPGGEALYRDAKPHFLRLKKALTWRGVRSKEFFSSCIVGLSLAAAHMGFLVAFYLIANHFGAWSPQEVNYEDSVSTAIPWVSGIAIGLLAATSEEFLFRLFAIPFLQRLTRSNLLAVVLPAFSWGFLHAAYPNEPPYIRGLEVGLIGIVAGIVMLRWGIVATLVWHYTVDAALVGLLLIRSSSLYFKISGVVVGLAVLLPLAVNITARLRRGGFEDDADLLNQAPDPVEEHAPATTRAVAGAAAPTAPLSQVAVAFLAFCILAGGLAAWKLKPEHLGDYLKLQVNPKEARAISASILKQRGVDPGNYRTATVFVDVTDGEVNEYLREKIGVRALNEIYRDKIPAALWDTRFFRDGDPEEYSVVLRPDGSLHSIHHELAEKAQGASLSREQAVAKAEAFLVDTKKVDLSQWALVDYKAEKRPNRVDHTLKYQFRQALDDPTATDEARHAFARIELAVVGDEVTNYRTTIKVPDEWLRKHEEKSALRTILSYFPLLFAAGLLITALVFFLRQARSELMRAVPWTRFTVWAAFALAGYVAVILCGNRWAQALSQYQTSMPLRFLLGGLGIGVLVGAAFYFGVVLLLFAMAWFFLKQAFTEGKLPGWGGMPQEYYRDALLIGLGGTAGLIGLGRATEWASSRWPSVKQSFGTVFGADYDAALPAVSIPGQAVLHGLLFCGLIGVVTGFVIVYCKSPLLRALLYAGGVVALTAGWGSPADFVKQLIARGILLAVLVLGIRYLARLNLLGYFLVLTIPSLLLGAEELLSQPNAFYHRQGYIVVAFLVALVLWPVARVLTARRAAQA
ncbi:MAG TPA: CPBP family intramembrane glutamic endopeptidase [Dongiaceae bacterium]|nr:CPBP family intramembrane glutamic endopeptidase [Dongiaceae bacterium]